jgi:hypothetical protein
MTQEDLIPFNEDEDAFPEFIDEFISVYKENPNQGIKENVLEVYAKNRYEILFNDDIDNNFTEKSFQDIFEMASDSNYKVIKDAVENYHISQIPKNQNYKDKKKQRLIY